MEQQEREVPVSRLDNTLIEQEFESVKEKFGHVMHKMEDEMSKFRTQMIVSRKNCLLPSINTTSTASTTSTSSSLRSMSAADLDQHYQNERQHSSSDWHHQVEQRSSSSLSSRSTKTSSVRSSIKSAFEEKDKLIERHKQQLEATASMNNEIQHCRQSRASPTPSPINWLNELSSPLVKDDGTGQRMLQLRFDVAEYEPDQIVVKTVNDRLMVHAKREQMSQNSSVYSEYNREFLLPAGLDPDLIRSSLSADGVLIVEAPLPITDAPSLA